MTTTSATATGAISAASGDSRPFEAGRDTASPNRNLTPLTTAIDGEGRLQVGGCALADLARRYGTPLYVLDEATLRATASAYRSALASHYPGAALAVYASKANSSLAITALVAAEGLGLDAVSAGELLTAVGGGMPPERIVFHGNNKSLEELRLAAEQSHAEMAMYRREAEKAVQAAEAKARALAQQSQQLAAEATKNQTLVAARVAEAEKREKDQAEEAERALAQARALAEQVALERDAVLKVARDAQAAEARAVALL